MLILTRRFIAEGRAWRVLLLSLLLGAFAALALPPFFAVPVLWLSLPGLLLLLELAPTRRRAALIGWAWGWGFQMVGLYWITEAILTEADRLWWAVPIAVPALALAMGAYTILPALAAWASPPGWRRALSFAGAWVGAEMLKAWFFTGFPWNLLGTVWAFDALPLQSAAWISAYGMSLVTVLLALAPLFRWRGVLAAAVTLAAFAGLGAWRLDQPEPPEQPVTVVLVQGNVAQQAKWDPSSRWPIFRRYLELTREGAARAAASAPAGNRIVAVWPETASPFLLAQDPDARRYAAEVLPENGFLLAGTVRADFSDAGQATAVYNSMVAIDRSAALLGSYDKTHLVPFGEYMPLSGLLPLRVVRGGMDFTGGHGPVTLDIPGLPGFSPLICYEVIFPGAVAAAERPAWMLNITNDAWFGTSTGPYQHLAAVRLRTVEEGLPIARAAQTGISAVFDARGRERGALALGETGVLTRNLPGALPPTFFARHGLWVPGLLALVAFLLGYTSRVRRFTTANSPSLSK
ncbi:apolipoprotein N-acyltransferase [Roseomonas elaeocarpi]|uniref:Apolipoprotein N-acyltransferase n=1 Tax=Roseomonas elaeocarpi TaxID=907779 RepID=A0ABV6JYA1_9PROT